MNQSSIKLGIIGLGAFGSKILKPISFLHTKEEIEVQAVCDINLQLARKIAIEHDIPHFFSSHQEMLSDVDLDLVYIATPPATHEFILHDVLQKKIHLLCEKPLANSISEANNMWLKAEQANIIHAVHFSQNYLPQINTFHHMIKTGYIGELKRINITMHYLIWPPEWQQNSWITGREQGGFLLEQGVHFIQAIQRIFGRITHVKSKLQFPNNHACEESVIATMKLETGETVVIDGLSGIAGDENVALTAYGTDGTISLKNFKSLLAGKSGIPLEEVESPHPSRYPWIIKHLINAINGRPANIYDFSKGYEAQVVLDTLRKGDNKLVDLSSYYKVMEKNK